MPHLRQVHGLRTIHKKGAISVSADRPPNDTRASRYLTYFSGFT